MPFHVIHSNGSAPEAAQARSRLMADGYGVSAFPHPRYYISSVQAATEEQCLWLLKGELQVVCESETHILRAGDRVLIPAGESYKYHVLSETGSFHLTGRKIQRRARSA